MNGGSVHAGTALEGGSKIAYDPRDLIETEQDGGKMPTLTLLEEVLLLGLKDKQVPTHFVLAAFIAPFTHVKQ
jgi:golgi phosphoprotein 3